MKKAFIIIVSLILIASFAAAIFQVSSNSQAPVDGVDEMLTE
jgi:uncharacterized protein YxeA